MKKYIFTILFALIATVSFAQTSNYHPKHFRMPHVDLSEYCVIDSLPLERITIYSPYDYEEDKDVIKLGEGEYLIEMPHKDKMIIRTNKERTKAIVVYNSYCFGRHLEFNIKENEKRLVLWYMKDEKIYVYAYDKIKKVCKYSETREEFGPRFWQR